LKRGRRRLFKSPGQEDDSQLAYGCQGSPFSPLQLLEVNDVHRLVRHDPLQPAILLLQGLQFGELAGIHTRLTLVPCANRLDDDAVRTSNSGHARSALDFLKNLHDPLFAVFNILQDDTGQFTENWPL